MDTEKTNFNKWQLIIIGVNIIGIICLIIFGSIYLSFDETIRNPDAMLPMATYEGGGLILTLGTLPLILANTLAFIFIKQVKPSLRLLFFIPAIICICLVIHFFITGTSDEGNDALFNVAIEINTDDEIYGLSNSYGIDKECMGEMFVVNADYKAFKGNVEVLYFPADFPEGTTDFSKFYMDISVYPDSKAAKNGDKTNCYPLDSIEFDAITNRNYKFVLEGNQKDGYNLTPVHED